MGLLRQLKEIKDTALNVLGVSQGENFTYLKNSNKWERVKIERSFTFKEDRKGHVLYEVRFNGVFCYTLPREHVGILISNVLPLDLSELGHVPLCDALGLRGINASAFWERLAQSENERPKSKKAYVEGVKAKKEINREFYYALEHLTPSQASELFEKLPFDLNESAESILEAHLLINSGGFNASFPLLKILDLVDIYEKKVIATEDYRDYGVFSQKDKGYLFKNKYRW